MAKCDLSIELDEPNRVYHEGEKVQGVVHVKVDSTVKCTGLVLSTGWKTHGRGNVTSGPAEETTVFSGQWTQGTKYEYRFSLSAGDWPQTYHGKFLSIDHYVEAKAKIPWAFDPKAATPFMVRVTQLPSWHAEEVGQIFKKSKTPQIIGMVLVAVFCVPQLLVTGWIGLGVLSFVGLAAAVFWLKQKFLPRYLLGTPNFYIQEDTLAPGSELVGEFITQTRKTVVPNAITVALRATEVCVSGSGSNRRTHKNVIFDQIQELQSNTTLQAGTENRCPFSFQIPEDAALSVKLTDNSLIWSIEVEVDIPRWPDWRKDKSIYIVPADEKRLGSGSDQSGEGVTMASGQLAHEQSQSEDSVTENSNSVMAEGVTFVETVAQVWAVRNDRDQLEMVVDAVTGLSFTIEAQVERRLLYAGDEDPHVYKGGYAVWARYPDPMLPLVLYVPHDLGDEFEQLGRGVWTGRGMVVGWDSLHGRLQIKLDSTS
ncbi:MAG: hypothetical protein L7W43_08495 [Rubripirellula sp.]|nr:hypothetical protein [Rhodopirellula sp.]MCH1439682.1 hypothetical protein [Rubripirellula sp.]OUX08651.1 MAG: hypothetical protein CBE00_01205 [Planctomycetaceae bacterium TMED240]